VPPEAVRLVRACQSGTACHLGGGAALSGAFLGHRLSADIDLVFHDAEALRAAVRELPGLARECGLAFELVRDGGTFVRGRLDGVPGIVRIDATYEPGPDLEPAPPAVEGVIVESLVDLRASKLTCLLSRSEPRDLVDLLFLDRAGHPPERDLPLALRKDSGIDPGVLAWLLGQFPVRPLPPMLLPLSESGLERYRDELRERLRALAVPRDDGP
jgi:hypothetical protein